MITREQYIEENKEGLAGNDWSYYTPALRVAKNLGLNGIDISKCPVITGFRFGGTPESFISTNYATNECESGLSVYTNKDVIRAEFEERGNKKYFTGILVDSGSDGESIILPFEAENFDN